MKYGSTIKLIRENDGRYTTSQMAEKINVSRSYLSRIENNRVLPSIDILESISKLFGTSLPFLTFFAMSEEDVSESKRDLFKAFKPVLTEIALALMSDGESN